jgi:hypothetical protein
MSFVVGGGNSAGQAAVFLAQSSTKVHLFVRSEKLSDSMSQYLVGRIEAHPRIEIHYRTRITGLRGAGHLEHVEWRDDALAEAKSGPIRHVLVMAGAAPRTEWLEDSFVMDNRGFIVTGPDLAAFAGGSMAAKTASTHARNRRSRNLCGWRHASRNCETGCLRSRRRFYGGTPGASISCRVRGSIRFGSTSANGTGFGHGLTGSQFAHPCHINM